MMHSGSQWGAYRNALKDPEYITMHLSLEFWERALPTEAFLHFTQRDLQQISYKSCMIPGIWTHSLLSISKLFNKLSYRNQGDAGAENQSWASDFAIIWLLHHSEELAHHWFVHDGSVPVSWVGIPGSRLPCGWHCKAAFQCSTQVRSFISNGRCKSNLHLKWEPRGRWFTVMNWC